MDKDYIIKKWLNKDLTKEEQIAFHQIEDSALLDEILEEAKRFKNQSRSKVIPFEQLEEKLKHSKESTNNWMQLVSKIAAVIVVSIGLYFLFRGDQNMVYSTPLAQKEVVDLPDSSQVTLNKLSELRFNDANWDTDRSVELKGEAYFDVAKGKKFDVNTPMGVISVLGTEFNVVARDSVFSVACFEGLVQVFHNNKITRLPAGKAYHFSNSTAQVLNVALAQPKWLQNLSVFEEATIGQVFNVLEEEFKVRVVFDQIDVSTKFTGAFEHNNLENALEAITQTLGLTYELSDAKTVIIKNAKK